MNGRPEKQADVCYSWWILSVLSIIGKVDWINTNQLASFICACQDLEDGGIADRPGNMADVFHTFFGIAGLSLLGWFDNGDDYSKFKKVDAVFALPVEVVERLQLKSQTMSVKSIS